MIPGIKATGLTITWWLLLLAGALLQAEAIGDTVTWEQFKENFFGVRAVGPLPDNNASVLTLEFCQITEIKQGSFDGLPNLVQIRLSHNKIQHLDPTVFKSVNGLRVLAVQNNTLTEVPNFGEHSLFPNMTKLKLHSNQISKLDNPKVFSSLVSLQYLHLQKNQIKFLHPEIFKALTNLISVNLSNNKIKYIPDKMFHIPSLQRIYLEDNLISYVAPEAISSSSLQNLYLKFNRLIYLPEHFVSKLKNASAGLKYIGLNENPWQCGCLQELMAEANSTGVGFFIPSDVCESRYAVQPTCNRPSQEEALASLSEHVL